MKQAVAVMRGPFAGAAAWLGSGGRGRRFSSAFLTGACASLALAPFHFLPILLICFTVPVWLLDYAENWRAAAVIGWWFGFGFFLSGLYWVGIALLVDAENFAHFLPVAVLVLPGGLALFSAGAFALAKLFWRVDASWRLLAFALAWSVFEWLRGHLFTGFPWNLIGYAWSAGDGWMLSVLQSASVIGVYGLGLLTVPLAALPALLANGDWRGRQFIIAALLGGLALSASWSYGAVRLSRPAGEEIAGAYLRIVQPNIAQTAKWNPEQQAAIFRQLLRLSGAPASQPITHVIWPESAIPFFVEKSEAARAMMAELVVPTGAVITGALRQADPNNSDAGIYNSVLVIDGDGRIVTHYDKSHLVPFGEYLPFPRLLAAIGLKKLTVDLGAFSEGAGIQTLMAPGMPKFSALICYEAIFPGHVADDADRPQWLLNVTNDAWFGDTSGPAQHLAQARVRAIEEGLPLLRAANTGISAVIDAHGRIRAALPLNQEGVIETGLPPALPPTIYARLGDQIYFGLLLLIGVFPFIAGWLQRRFNA